MNKSGINVLSCFKLVSFDTDDLKLLTAVYRVMYPDRQTEESNQDAYFFLSPGIVQYYFTHSIKLGEEHVMHYFACVRWFLAQEESYFANPIKINKNKFHPGGQHRLCHSRGYIPGLPLLNLSWRGNKQLLLHK